MATAEAVSWGEPPPTETKKSQPSSFSRAKASLTFLVVGLGFTSSKIA